MHPFDFMLMDCPPSLGILMTNALAAADELLIPIQCEYLALEGLSKTVQVVEQIKEVGANPNPFHRRHPDDHVRRPHQPEPTGRE